MTSLGRSAVELDQEIKIAALGVEIIACRRAEQIETAHMEPPAQFLQFLSMR